MSREHSKKSMAIALELAKRWWDEGKLSYNWNPDQDVRFLASVIDSKTVPNKGNQQMETKQAIKEIEFTRACPKALAEFDPYTKRCAMNCGPHAQDPRTRKERMFLCDDCITLVAPSNN